MNSFGVFFFACATIIAVSGVQGASLECPQICPYLYRPTCAKSEQNEYVQYSNDCELKVFNCQRQKSALPTYEEVDLDFCTTTELTEGLESFDNDLEDSDRTCLKPCPRNLSPVCASNGSYRTTFSNQCIMDMFDCLHRHHNKNGWRLLKTGQC